MSNLWTQYDSMPVRELNRHTRHGNRDDCLNLLESARDSTAFLSYIRTVIKESEGELSEGKKWPTFNPISENEFKNLSWKVQGQELWEVMKSMSPVDACRPGLWLYATLSAIESGAIEPHYLAAGMNGNNDTGLARIDESIKNPDKIASRETPIYLETTRLILRRAYGAISDRGQKAVYTDVPYAKIWWQRYLAEDMQRATGIDPDEMMAFFSEQGIKTVYGVLTTLMSSELTVIGDRPVRDSLMGFFYRANRGQGNVSLDFPATSKYFKKLTKRLGVVLGWRAMGVMNFDENIEIIGECAADVRRGEANDEAESRP